MLYEKLEREAGGGASLSELQADIDKEVDYRPLLSERRRGFTLGR